MNLAPSPDGGLDLEAADSSDWQMLLGILRDAQTSEFDLATHVGAKMEQNTDWQDWIDYVIPDMKEGFLTHLKAVLIAIETARLQAANGPGVVHITRDNVFHWYSALNQARLALEAIHHLDSGGSIDPGQLSPAGLKAFIRSRFYLEIQSALLDIGLG